MNRLYYFIFIITCLLLLNGCGMVAMKSVNTIRGGTSDLSIVQPVQNLQSYKSINLIRFKSSTNEQLTPELLTYMNKAIHDELSDNGAKLKKDGQLRVSGMVLHLDEGLRNKQILVRVKLQDTNTGRSLGVVNVMGQSVGFRGIKSVADVVAEGVTKLLASNNFPGIEEDSSWF